MEGKGKDNPKERKRSMVEKKVGRFATLWCPDDHKKPWQRKAKDGRNDRGAKGAARNPSILPIEHVKGEFRRRDSEPIAKDPASNSKRHTYAQRNHRLCISSSAGKDTPTLDRFGPHSRSRDLDLRSMLLPKPRLVIRTIRAVERRGEPRVDRDEWTRHVQAIERGIRYQPCASNKNKSERE